MNTDQLLVRLDAYEWWGLKTINSEEQGRGYECRVKHDGHYYTAWRRKPAVAMLAVLTKISGGETDNERTAKKKGEDRGLKLVGGWE